MRTVMADEQRDVIEILIHDHREVEQMFSELESLVGMSDDTSRQRRKDLVEQATIELVRHSVAEEAEVYPRVKERVSDAEAERAKQKHTDPAVTMKRLESLQPGDAMFDQQLPLLSDANSKPADADDGRLFPHMRSMFTEEE